jgi:hypothetical protein
MNFQFDEGLWGEEKKKKKGKKITLSWLVLHFRLTA